MNVKASPSAAVVAASLVACFWGPSLHANPASVVFANSSSWDIYEVYLSPSEAESWGPDQLEDDILASGAQLTLRGVECGHWDVKLVDEDGDVCVVTEVYLCGKEGWDITDDALLSCQRQTAGSSLTMFNESSWDIHRIYLSPSDESTWGPDQLEEDILHSGQYLELAGIACDTYDIRLVDEDGDVCELHGVDICMEETGWHITDKVLLACQLSSQ